MPAQSWWTDKPVLVTGCTGLLGSWLCRALCDRGARVSGLTLGPRSAWTTFERLDLTGRVTLHEGSVTDGTLLSRLLDGGEGGIVFHLAAQSQQGAARRDPVRAFDVNTRGTWQVLEAARRAPAPPGVVLASTVAVHGDRGEEVLTEDQGLPVLGSPYAASKACAELVSLSYAQATGLRVAVARCTNLYGGGDPNPERIVPGAVASLLRGDPPVVRSDGRARRDYLYVEDAVAGFLALGERLGEAEVSGRVFHLASERVVSVLELVGILARATGRPGLRPRILGEASPGPAVVRVSAARARRRLDWEARVSLEDGLRATLDWHATEMVSASRVSMR